MPLVITPPLPNVKGSAIIGAIVSAVFALQLGLAGVGAQCVMPASGGGLAPAIANGSAGGSMGDMQMPGSPADGGRSPDGSRDHGVPCDQSLPAAACHGMAACAAAFLGTPTPESAAALPPAVRIAIGPVAMPPSVSTAPEPPPPRA